MMKEEEVKKYNICLKSTSYPLSVLASSTFTEPEFLNKLIIIARATAASAAAKTITNIAIIWPSKWIDDENLLKAIKFIFAAFKINSIPIKIAIAFFLVITANIPKQKRIDDTNK